MFPITYHVGEVLDGYETMKKLAGSLARVIPGHDPLVHGALSGGPRRARRVGGAARCRSERLTPATQCAFARSSICPRLTESAGQSRDPRMNFRGEEHMTIILRSPSRRRVLGYGAAGVAALGMPSIARAQTQLVRIGLPTKTYYPTIIAETALRQKLFDKEGIKAELTIYRGGAECFEALAAGAADVVLNSASSVAAGLKKGVMVRNVAGAALGYYGWHLVVKTGLADQGREGARRQEGRHHVGRLRHRHPGAVDAAGSQGQLHARAARRRRTGAEPALRQHRRERDVLAAVLQAVHREDRAQPDRLRRRGAAEHDRRLDGDRQVHQGQAAGAAEDAERALWRARLPAGSEEPRRTRSS